MGIDPSVAELGVDDIAAAFDAAPGEPSIAFQDGSIVAIPGAPGQRLDTQSILTGLEANVPSEPGGSIRIEADVLEVRPLFDGPELDAWVGELNRLTSRRLPVTAGGAINIIDPEDQRSWMRLLAPENPGDQPLTTFDEASVQEWLDAEFESVLTQPDLSTLTIVDKTPVLADDAVAMKCCDASSASRILNAIVAEAPDVELDLVPADVNPLIDFGVVELIGEFTTEHPAGQSRVDNIQRMADIVRGTLIEPDGVLSINDRVGRRTLDGGFVEAGVIYNGVLDLDVGGGVSQFATTIFNAAFFAGLDFDEYQAHSIYFSRYPYGREATISFPAPDLQIRNTTPYPVLVWTSYTSTSITVELYSTTYAVTTESGAFTQPAGACTRAVTERTRTYPDKDPVVDTVEALYQPQEGIGCNGLPTAPPPVCGAGQEPFDSTGNGFDDSCRTRTTPLPPPQPDTLSPAEELGFSCTQGQQAVDSTGDGLADTCQTPVFAGDDPCAPDVGIDSDGNGFIDRCVPRE